MMSPTLLRSSAAVAVLAGTAAVASADLVAQDSFLLDTSSDPVETYEADKSIRDKHPDSAFGFTTWRQWSGNSGNFVTRTDSLGPNPGGHVQIVGVGSTAGELARTSHRLIESNSSNSFYMGSLLNRGNGLGLDVDEDGQDDPAPINADGWALAGFTNLAGNGNDGLMLRGPEAGGSTMFGLTWGFAGNAEGTGYDLVVRHRHRSGGVITVDNDVLLSDAAADTSYVALFKLDLNTNTAGDGQGPDDVTYWIGSLDSFDATDEATATATALATGKLGSYSFNTASDLRQGLFGQYKYEANGAFFDELTLATDFASVAAMVPEPASAGVLGLIGLLLGRRRR